MVVGDWRLPKCFWLLAFGSLLIVTCYWLMDFCTISFTNFTKRLG